MSGSTSGGRTRRVGFEEFWPVWREVLRALEIPRTAALVEGERDRHALRELGVTTPIVLVHRGQALAGVAGDTAGSFRRVVVLTDWDPAGGRLARRLRALLEDGRIEVDVDLRRRLGHSLRGEVVHLEGLAGWARRRAEREGLLLEEWIADPDRSPTG
ncbi:MAG: hypothetical protein ACREC5_06815 [Thermoplasmata archaeon]